MRFLYSFTLFFALSVLVRAQTVSSVVQNPQTLSCGLTRSAIDARLVAKICNSGNTTCFYTGYQQVSSVNQDPILIRFDGSTQTFCQTQIETTGDDGSGIGLLWDSANKLYGCFTSKGTQPGIRYQNWTGGGWIPNFYGTIAQSNDVKVSVILELNVNTGVPVSGTFVGARLSSGSANTCLARSMTFDTSGNPVIFFDSYYQPVDSRSPVRTMTCSGSSPLPFQIKFNQQLSVPLEICAATVSSGSTCTLSNISTCPQGRISNISPGFGGIPGVASFLQWTILSILAIIIFS